MEKGLDSYKLKMIALVFMILDHVHTYLFHSQPRFISLITRFVAPLFLYLMIDGFYHTRSRIKFLIRLFVAGLIMKLGNTAINEFFHHLDPIKYDFYLPWNNIFLTLAFLFAFVWCLENVRQRNKKVLNIILALIIAVCSILCEGGIYMLPIAFVFWLFHEKKHLQFVGICVWCIIILAFGLLNYFKTNPCDLYTYLCDDCQWAMFSVIPFILLYNGKRGKNTAFSKYLFYIIYPLHLWLLLILYLKFIV